MGNPAEKTTEQEFAEKVWQAFKALDKDNDGKLTTEELTAPDAGETLAKEVAFGRLDAKTVAEYTTTLMRIDQGRVKKEENRLKSLGLNPHVEAKNAILPITFDDVLKQSQSIVVTKEHLENIRLQLVATNHMAEFKELVKNVKLIDSDGDGNLSFGEFMENNEGVDSFAIPIAKSPKPSQQK